MQKKEAGQEDYEEGRKCLFRRIPKKGLLEEMTFEQDLNKERKEPR